MSEAYGAIFDVAPLIRKTKRSMTITNNVFMETFNWRPWIAVELRCILNPYSLKGTLTEDEEYNCQMGNVGFPEEVLEIGRETMRKGLEELVKQAVGNIRSDHEYQIQFVGREMLDEYHVSIVDYGNKEQHEKRKRDLDAELFQRYGGYTPNG